MDLTHNYGADGVLITASTKSNDVISQAAQMSRKRGRIILVGVVIGIIVIVTYLPIFDFGEAIY